MSETVREHLPGDTDAVRTGVPPVDEALATMTGLDERPVREHPAVYDTVHDALRAVLSGDPPA